MKYIAAFDPGAHCGVAVVAINDIGALPPRVVLCQALPSDGSGGTPESLLASMTPKPDLVALESVKAIYPRARFGVSMANAIQEATRMEERLAACAKELGIPSVRYTAAEWRRWLTTRANPSNAVIHRALRHASRVLDLPKRSNEHGRDALGLALFAAQKHRLHSMRKTA